ncbi:sensor domain-containing protein [Thiohalorhabdus sp.]|uniref:sensor domain-containing protein n=1 Tax=Thiohalorhabdus sp. TaxID=3094134 RepID=UPI002FC285A6
MPAWNRVLLPLAAVLLATAGAAGVGFGVAWPDVVPQTALATGFWAEAFGGGLGLLGVAATLGRAQRPEGEIEQGRILSNLQGMVYRCHNRPDWPMDFVSEGALALTGYTPEQLLAGHPSWGDRIHPEDAEYAWEAVQKGLAAGEKFQVTYRFYHADGYVRWFWEQGGTVGTREGQTVLEGYINDVTEAEAYRRQQERLSAIVEASLLVVGMAGPDGRSLYLNRAGRALMGFEAEEDISRYFIRDYHPEWAYRRVRDEALPHAAEVGPWHGEVVLLSHNGEEIPISAVLLAHRDPRGSLEYYSLVGTDIRALKRTQEALQQERDLSQALLTHLPGLFYLINVDFNLVHWNQGLETVTGYRSEELRGTSGLAFFGPEDAAYIRNQLRHTLTEGHATAEAELLTKNGDAIPYAFEGQRVDLEGRPHVIGFASDITLRRQQEAEIRRLAYGDPLTGLPNRTNLHHQVHIEISRAQRHGGIGALVYMDLDDFKAVNDAFGHPSGDHLLRAFGGTLAANLREEDTLARVGGDEFVLLLPDLAEEVDTAAVRARQAVDRIHNGLTTPLSIGDRTLQVKVSSGIALFPEPEAEVDNLLQQADTAMYQAKNQGKGEVRFYDPAMLEAVRSRLDLEQELHRALDEGHLALHFQPIMAADGHRVTALEALARWEHPERGWISPAVFIPLAEKTGLIHRLGEWVVTKALAQARKLQEADLAVPVSVNVSPQQLLYTRIADVIGNALREQGLDGTMLDLEVTEQALLENPETVAEQMGELRRFGVRFSIDDFGTGYSSLISLKQLPLNALKVDKSFVQDLLDSAQDKAIVETILAMGNQLGLATVAEGVETREQAQLLTQWGIQSLQGFLYAQPMPPEELDHFLAGRLPG